MTLLEFWKLVDLSAGDDGCWPWRGNVDRDGYGIFHRWRTHRFAYEEVHGVELQPEQVIRHRCDNPPCCNPRHHVVGTQLENIADRVERDRSARGPANGRSELTEIEALHVYYAAGSYAEIAAQYGVSKWSVRDIKTGRNWAWLTGKVPTVGTTGR